MSTLISYLERYGDITLILQCLSIIAVHGLGANPDWAWTRKRAGRTSGDEIHVNWLKDEDMLPSKMPNARIMTFNYESKWHKDAPRQRRSLCADQLLTALDNKRKQASAHSILFFFLFSLNDLFLFATLCLMIDLFYIMPCGPDINCLATSFLYRTRMVLLVSTSQRTGQ